jgi:hypothetical protein
MYSFKKYRIIEILRTFVAVPIYLELLMQHASENTEIFFVSEINLQKWILTFSKKKVITNHFISKQKNSSERGERGDGVRYSMPYFSDVISFQSIRIYIIFYIVYLVS